MTESSESDRAPVERPSLTTGEVLDTGPLERRVPIRLDEIPFAVALPDRVDPLTWRRTLVDPSTGHAVFHVHFGPGQRGEAHWHPSDTLYVFLEGSLTVEGEATYHAGDIRSVEGGFAYGAEVGGPEGCTFLFISLGPYDRHDPDAAPPPAGRWDQPSG